MFFLGVNLILCGYLSLVHQRGVVDTALWLGQQGRLILFAAISWFSKIIARSTKSSDSVSVAKILLVKSVWIYVFMLNVGPTVKQIRQSSNYCIGSCWIKCRVVLYMSWPEIKLLKINDEFVLKPAKDLSCWRPRGTWTFSSSCPVTPPRSTATFITTYPPGHRE